MASNDIASIDLANKPEKLTDLGTPPTNIEEYVALEVIGNTITLCFSDKIEASDDFLKNYRKSARMACREKYPNYNFTTKSCPVEDFERTFAHTRMKTVEERSAFQDMMKTIIDDAVTLHASDIHFDTTPIGGIIKMRVYGDLQKYRDLPSESLATLISVVYNTMCEIAENMYTASSQQSAMFRRVNLNSILSGIRVICTPSLNGPSMVLRLLYQENIELNPNMNPLQQLGYSPEHIEIFGRLISQPSGIIFIAGPTGSGKSTTLKYILTGVAENPKIQVISIEDPPEYPIKGVRQIPVSGKSSDESERSKQFLNGIMATLRSDPDVIMIGEIRDVTSARTAINCAQTGHQVWTTLHANNAFAIVARMADLLMEKMPEGAAYRLLLDATIINGLMFQRLVPVLCEHCKVPIKAKWDSYSDAVRDRLIDSFIEDFPVYDVRGDIDEKATREKTIDEICSHVYVRRERDNECPENSGKEIHDRKCHDGVTTRRIVAEVVYASSKILDEIGSLGTVEARRQWLKVNPRASLQAHSRMMVMNGEVDPFDAEHVVGPLNSDIEERRLVDGGIS